MFTPKNIQGALEELYDLCDPDYMVDMLVNYSEEFDDISPALLAKSFQKNAEMISEYRVLSSAGEGIDYQGKVLLNSRAVRLLSYVEDMSGDEKVRTIQSKELWLAEDMTFYVVSCMSTITMDKEEAICLNEHRSVVSLRHSSITYKLKLNGGDMKSVQGDSGHAQVKMVADVYSHIIDDDRRLNAERMEAAFYSGRQATPEPVQPAATESSADDKELLLKLLQNPEMAALLKSLAKTL